MHKTQYHRELHIVIDLCLYTYSIRSDIVEEHTNSNSNDTQVNKYCSAIILYSNRCNNSISMGLMMYI